MTEIPEHLRKRAEAARQKAAEKSAADGADGAADASPPSGGGDAGGSGGGGGDSRIPAHLLERSKAAKSRKGSDEGGGSAVQPAATAGAVATAAAPAGPVATGPAGHTQRLLTVVKAGSIQDVKSTPVDKVHTWPHLIAGEFVAAMACLTFVLLFSIFYNAPLLELANFNQTPNPSKAPWYFLGLQELLTMFHPMVAGVTIPGMGIFLLILAPYIDRNPSNKPEDRKFAITVFTVQLMFWAALVITGSFFRGPGFNFVAPWNAGLFFEL